MRMNIYSQEITKEIELVETVAKTGITYYGVRIYLASHDILHHTPEDDDRSAITFWIPNAKKFTQHDLADVFEMMSMLARRAPKPSDGINPDLIIREEGTAKVQLICVSCLNPIPIGVRFVSYHTAIRPYTFVHEECEGSGIFLGRPEE